MKPLGNYTLTLGQKTVLPLVVGGMGVDISTSELALAAARCGAIGHISDAMSPYVSDRKFKTRFQNERLKMNRARYAAGETLPAPWDPTAVYQAQRNHVGSTMDAKRGDGLVFANIMEKLTMGAPKETLQARLNGALDAGIDGITLSAGLHTGTMAMMAENPRFRDAFIGIIVSSARALKLFLRGASRVSRMPDYVIVEGPLAGGHLGFGEDWREHKLVNIVDEVIAFLAEEGLQIPVIPAGGVFTGKDAIDCLARGAAAVQVATRFTIARECGLPSHVKQIYLNSQESDVEVNLTSPTGYPMRMLKSSPSLVSNVKPNCDALGYILNGKIECAYRDAYDATGVNAAGEKLPVQGKMCICTHFMKHDCYTCGHNVFRLKETTTQLADGSFYLPHAEEVIFDYLNRLEPARLGPNEVELAA